MSEAVFAVIRRTKEILQNALVELDKFERSLREAEPQVQAETALTPKALDELPWTKYKTGNGEWIKSNLDNPTVKTLNELLNKYGKVDIHRFTYKFSGSDKAFIARFPKK